MVGYVYSIRFKITGQWYIGCRYAKHLTNDTVLKDLWIKYFTSSKLIKNLIKAHGVDSFEPKIRKVFDNPADAKAYEISFLKKVNARVNSKFLNQCNSVFENVPALSWITNGIIDTMIASNKPLIPGFRYGRSQNNKVRKHQQSPLKGRIHVYDLELELHRMIPASEYDSKKHRKLKNDFNKDRNWIYDPITYKCKLIKKDDQIPNGWKQGNPHRSSSSWFYNPDNGEQRQIPTGSTPPIGFIKGRPSTHMWFTNLKTNENLLCKIDEPPPAGYIKGRSVRGRK